MKWRVKKFSMISTQKRILLFSYVFVFSCFASSDVGFRRQELADAQNQAAAFYV
jgi:hypothetical protein